MKRKIPQVLTLLQVVQRLPSDKPVCVQVAGVPCMVSSGGLRFKDELMLEEIAAADTVIETLPHTEETIQGRYCVADRATPAVGQTRLYAGRSKPFYIFFAVGRRCTTCNNVTVEQTITPTIPHTEETIQGTPATCTQTGLSDGKRCTVCNNITKQQTVIPTLPHP